MQQQPTPWRRSSSDKPRAMRAAATRHGGVQVRQASRDASNNSTRHDGHGRDPGQLHPRLTLSTPKRYSYPGRLTSAWTSVLRLDFISARYRACRGGSGTHKTETPSTCSPTTTVVCATSERNRRDTRRPLSRSTPVTYHVHGFDRRPHLFSKGSWAHLAIGGTPVMKKIDSGLTVPLSPRKMPWAGADVRSRRDLQCGGADGC